MQRNWATADIFYVRRATPDDDRLRTYFAEIEKNTPSASLHMKYINFDNNRDFNGMISSMDSNRKTVILVGSLDENLGKAVCAKLTPSTNLTR